MSNTTQGTDRLLMARRISTEPDSAITTTKPAVSLFMSISPEVALGVQPVSLSGGPNLHQVGFERGAKSPPILGISWALVQNGQELFVNTTEAAVRHDRDHVA